MYFRKIVGFLILFILLGVGKLWCQTEKQFLKVAREAYAASEYYEAISYYKSALDFNKDNDEAHYHIAMSFYTLKDYEAARTFFANVKDTQTYPLLHFYAASNVKHLGEYKEAIALWEQFINLYPIPGYFIDKSNQEIASCYWALDQKAVKDLEVIQLAKPVNTGYSDFAANYISDKVLQVSSLQSITKNLKSDFQAQIYFYEETKGNFEKAYIAFPFGSSDTFDYANGFYFAEEEDFYYSKCYTEHELGEKICDLFVRSFDGSTWGEEEALNLNLPDYTETQAHVVKDLDGSTLLFFSSDRPGGKGKQDIWVAKQLEGRNFENPTNLGGAINTPDPETSPFFDAATQTLYFSSEWHYGFGGQDIFSSKLANGTWQKVVNLGRPINSSANDQYYSLNADKGALWASNRAGAMQLKGSACCFDIFAHAPETLKITVPDTSLLSNIPELDPKNPTTSNGLTPISLESLQKKLPATVYFHNDEPTPKSLATVTKMDYAACYEDYVSVKEDYVQALTANEAELWFQEVEAAYEELQAFLDLLIKVLPQQKVTLTVEGYCSPLAKNEYNINLAQRRIVSVENYILSWNNAALKPYYDSGKLVFVNAPIGEEKAAAGISDSVDDTKASIYAPSAAKERRAAIIGVGF